MRRAWRKQRNARGIEPRRAYLRHTGQIAGHDDGARRVIAAPRLTRTLTRIGLSPATSSPHLVRTCGRNTVAKGLCGRACTLQR